MRWCRIYSPRSRLYLVIALSALLGRLASEASTFSPVQPTLHPWRVVSFAEEAGLRGRNIFTLDFEREGTEGRKGTLWVASSDGLREFDGYRWVRHGISNGLPSEFIRSVLVTRSGILWVGSDKGAGVYDGRAYRTFGSEAGLAGPGVRRIVEDSDGTIWFCSDPWPAGSGSGGIASFKQGRWRAYGTTDGLPSEYVVEYFQDSDGTRWAVTKQGVARLAGDRWERVLTPDPGPYGFGSGCMAQAPGGPLRFSDGQSLFVHANGSWERVAGAELHRYGIRVSRDGRLIATRAIRGGRRAFVEWTGQAWTEISSGFDAPHGYVEDLREGPDGNFWAVGFDTLVCWRRNCEWDEFAELPPPRFVDASGQAWFARARGWSVPPSIPVRTRNNVWERLDQPCLDISLDVAGSVWAWSSNRVERWTGAASVVMGPPETGVQRIIDGVASRDGSFWVVGEDVAGAPGVATWRAGAWTFRPLPPFGGELGRVRLAAAGEGAWMWVPAVAGGEASAVHLLPGREEAVRIPRSISSAVQDRLYESVQSHLLWIYGDNGLFRHPLDVPGEWVAVEGLPGRHAYAIAERGRELWVSSSGATGGRDGLSRLLQGAWRRFPAELHSSLQLAADGSLLVGLKGWFEIFPDAVDPEVRDVHMPEEFSVESVVKDPQGRYWLGTQDSVFRFTPDGIAPRTEIAFGNSNYLSGEAVRIAARAVERFQGSGSYGNLSYSWRVDGGSWSRFSPEPSRAFAPSELGVGSHRVEVRSRDSSGDVDLQAAGLTFNVRPLPVQDQPWFLPVVIGIILLLAILGFAAVQARVELAAHVRTLEQRVAERTAALEVDLIARRKVEETLRESEERFSKAFRANPAILAVSTHPDGYYLDVNEAYSLLLGYSREEVLGRRAADLGLWPVPEQRAGIIEALAAGVPVREVECTIRAKSGRLLTVLVSAERIEVAGAQCTLFINHDITDRKETEAVMLEAQARFRQLAENIREVFWLTDVTKQQILYISPGYERIWGRTCASLQAAPISWLEAIHAEDRERVAGLARFKQATGEYDVEYRILRPDGSIRWIHDRAFPVKGADGQVYRIAGIAEDITDRRQLEAQFRQAQKMEALGTLSGGIAHDFNNILGAIVGNVHLARADLDPGHPAYESIVEIAQAADRARSLVRQILSFSRQQPQARQITSLEPILREAASLLRATLPAGVELSVSVDPRAPKVLADPSQIHQVLLNLVTNSWHALGGDSGRIEVGLNLVKVEARVAGQPQGLRPGSYACLSVADNGCGMDGATLERVFEPFFTTKEPGRGTGLGLSVVHGIVQSHDGVVGVSSRPGEGTTFQLYFPALQGEVEEPSPPAREILRGAGQRILYLDDEPPLVDMATRMLRRLGYEVEGFTSGERCLEALRANPRRYDLLITDLHMPGMDGLQLAQAARQARPDIRVLLSSGHLTDQVAARARAVNILQVLHKPVTLAELGAVLNESLSQRQP